MTARVQAMCIATATVPFNPTLMRNGLPAAHTTGDTKVRVTSPYRPGHVARPRMTMTA